ncbi:MAG: S49 family peptidase [Alphaproteobacteria bacterium]
MGSTIKSLARHALKPFGRGKPVVAVLRLGGVIGAGSPLRPGLSLAGTAQSIAKAFSQSNLKAVALAINSPGGSPVQSTLIYQRIRALAAEKEIPVFAFCEDVAASGGYILALSGDEIFADNSSIIGSIGVISAGFGMVEALKKLGIERRVYTAGEKKLTLDPFQPENPSDIKRLKTIQRDIHTAFKALVTQSRGTRIDPKDKTLFTGEFWAGQAALERGLIDGIGDMRTVMRQRFGNKVKLVLVGHERTWLRRRLGASNLGQHADARLIDGLTRDIVSTMEERAWWSRYGF